MKSVASWIASGQGLVRFLNWAWVALGVAFVLSAFFMFFRISAAGVGVEPADLVVLLALLGFAALCMRFAHVLRRNVGDDKVQP